MSKVEVVERVVEELRMTEREKWQLAQWLQQDRLREWDHLFARIDRQRKGRRFTMAEIVREIKAYRREQRAG